MKKLLFGTLLTALVATTANAQSERAEQMRRIIDGLNSADPVTRLITLEEALAANDKNLKRIAIQSAMANADANLRSAAIEGVFASKSAYTIDIKSAQNENRSYILTNSGGQIDIRIEQFDSNTGDFLGYSSFSYKEKIPNSTRRQPRAHKGNFSGDRLTFKLDINELHNSTCSGTLQSNEGSSLLTGNMTCDRGSDGVYKIEIDILR